jgi:NAD+ diphosphatase
MKNLPPLFPDRSQETGYGINPLDRLSERRDDPAFIEALMRAPESRAVAIVRDTPVLRRESDRYGHLFALPEARELGPACEIALLGRTDERAFFGFLLDDSCAIAEEVNGRRRLRMPGRDDLAPVDLRTLAVEGLLQPSAVGLLGEAKSLLYWHARHRFCSVCGQPSELAAAGWRRNCPACQALHFPRTDPVVIMLAVDGDRCLLGRQPRFNKGMYSALAGFLEPGETIEAAVRREIKEEAGIVVGAVHYVASQPWPFPSSLMIGCLAEALTTTIIVDPSELEDARWFTRDEVAAMFEGRHPAGLKPSNPIAIAHHLLRAWLELQAA